MRDVLRRIWRKRHPFKAAAAWTSLGFVLATLLPLERSLDPVLQAVALASLLFVAVIRLATAPAGAGDRTMAPRFQIPVLQVQLPEWEQRLQRSWRKRVGLGLFTWIVVPLLVMALVVSLLPGVPSAIFIAMLACLPIWLAGAARLGSMFPFRLHASPGCKAAELHFRYRLRDLRRWLGQAEVDFERSLLAAELTRSQKQYLHALWLMAHDREEEASVEMLRVSLGPEPGLAERAHTWLAEQTVEPERDRPGSGDYWTN